MLLECSSHNASDTTSNAQWTNTFQKPVVLHPGDMVSIRSAFLNTNKTGSFGDITLEDPVVLSMRYGYHELNYINDNKQNRVNMGNHPDNDFYVMRDNNNHLNEGDAVVKVPSGTYSPSLLAETITQALTTIASTSLGKYNTNKHTFLYATGAQADRNKLYYNDVNSPVDNPLTTLTVEEGYNMPDVDDEITIHYTQDFILPRDLPENKSADATITAVNGRVITINPGLPTVGARALYQIYSIDSEVSLPNKFCKQSDVQASYNHDTNSWAGASQVGLTFNRNGDGRFDLVNYTPYYGPANTGTDAMVGIVNTTVNDPLNPNAPLLNFVDCQGGVFFTKLEPASFWQDVLGFNLADVLVTDTPQHTVSLQRGKTVSTGLFSIDALLNKNNLLQVPNDTVLTVTDQINTITATNNYQGISDGGYFLLRVSGLPVQYEEDNKIRNDILAVCPRQYNNNGYITFFGADGTLVYINTGSAFLLSSVDVAVLDPLTKTPVTTLGTGNSVFLEVTPGKQ